MNTRMVTALEIERGYVTNYWVKGHPQLTCEMLNEEIPFWWNTIVVVSDMTPRRRMAWLTLHNTTMKALGVILSNHRRVREGLYDQCAKDEQELL